MEHKKLGMLLLFDSNEDNTFNLVGQSKIVKNDMYLLNTYANTPCPASQLVYGNTETEVIQERAKMILNMSDESYCDEFVHPYL